MSTEMVNFLTAKFKTALEEVEKDGGLTEFPGRKIFQDISLNLETKVSPPIYMQPDDSLLIACLHSSYDAITECRLLYEARRRRALDCYTPKEWYQLRRIKGRLLKTLEDLHNITDAGLPTSVEGTIADQQIYPWTYANYRIYGFDDRMEEIVASLRRKGESGIKTIGIVGMGGSGKTTLCNLVFNHQVVKREFIPRIWVDVPNKFKSETDVTRSIVEYILEEIGAGEEDDDNNESQLEEEKEDENNSASLDQLLVTLHKHLSGKKYLIVFDDVWNLTSWYHKLVNITQMYTQDGIPLGLPNGYGGGIIVTSRLEENVKEMVGEANMHYPPLLDQENCWSIFLEETRNFLWNEARGYSMKTEILENCNGLPSAIKTLGRVIGKEGLYDFYKYRRNF